MRISQDAALGAFFVAVAAIALPMAFAFPFGTASRMGPGFFPVIIAVLLGITGAAILLRARLAASEPIGPVRWAPLAIVPGAILLFGLLVEQLGLPLAVVMLVVVSAMASVKFRLESRALAGAVLFAAICALVFVKLLGLPIPVFGSWLSPLGL